MVSLNKAEDTKAKYGKNFRYNALFVSGSTRQAVKEGRADFTPVFFCEVPRLLKEGYLSVDVVMIQVSIADEHGIANLKVKTLAQRAEALINIANSAFRGKLKGDYNELLGRN